MNMVYQAEMVKTSFLIRSTRYPFYQISILRAHKLQRQVL